MDGIFGVGIAEIIIIVLAILIVGGPKNAVKWSREAGRMLHQARQMWSQLVRELEKDLGDEGKEIMNVTRELTRNVKDIQSTANPTKLVRQASKMLEDTVKETDASLKPVIAETDAALKGKPPAKEPAAKSEETSAEKTASNGKYNHWLPKD